VGQQVVMGAMMTCSFGMAPATLVVLPQNRVLVNNMPAANIMDFKPIVNIPPFAMCQSLSNPTVAAATAAALGVLTPMPCLPVPTPWKPGSATVQIANFPALNNSCTCQCAWGGAISISVAGQVTTQVP
jgi:hypothetical protein